MELGADDYLTKPFNKHELLGVINARLKKQAAMSQQLENLFLGFYLSINDKNKYTNTHIFAIKLTALKSAQLTGRLIVKSLSKQEWTIYLYLGRILYATGGTHPVRRWQRNLAIYYPQLQVSQLKLPSEIIEDVWEYQLLGLWLKQQKIDRQVAQVIRDIVAEVLFDMMQAKQVMYEAKSESSLPLQLLLIDIEQALSTAQKTWQTWQAAKLTDLSPNKAPVLKRPDALQQQTSIAAYRQLTLLLDGKSTLRDLAILMKRQISEIASSLLPHIQAGVMELIDIPDLPTPVNSIPIAVYE
jgi:YesN/AraC family two-component response regulator